MVEPALPELEKELTAALEINPHVNTHQYPVTVRHEDGAVVLEGQVADIAAKRAAANTAYRIFRDRCPVVDRLRVVPGEHKDDRDLRDEIIDAFTKESSFAEYTLRTRVHGETLTVHDAGPGAFTIEAVIEDGVVTLNGRVGSLSHRRLAEVLAWWTAGCERVENRLEVSPPEEDDDNELTDAVRLVLEKDPLVHATQIRVGTAGGVVTLSGWVASEEEKRLALRDAWCVPGVWEVIDRIETGR